MGNIPCDAAFLLKFEMLVFRAGLIFVRQKELIVYLATFTFQHEAVFSSLARQILIEDVVYAKPAAMSFRFGQAGKVYSTGHLDERAYVLV